MQHSIYLDYAATTPVDLRVAKLMQSCLDIEGNFANPASRSHMYGWHAEEAVETARAQLAELIHADTREIVFTSGATESNNLAIKGLVEARSDNHRISKHIITSCIEHKAVLDTCAWLEERGHKLSYIQPDANGLICPELVKEQLQSNTVLVSLMHVNNELGTLTDVNTVGEICKETGIVFHVDAAQSMSRLPIDLESSNIDLMSMSAHKMYGPKGIGALYVRRSPELKLSAQIHGGGHERGMRSGTLATHQIAGFGLAASIIESDREKDIGLSKKLTDQFIAGVSLIDGVSLNGSRHQRANGIVNLSFSGVDGEAMLIALKKLAVSTGSACTSASLDPSYVLTAMGQTRELAQGALRFSFGRFTSSDDIDVAIEEIDYAMKKLNC